MVFKKKSVYITLGAMIFSVCAFSNFRAKIKVQETFALEQSVLWDFSSSKWQEEFHVLGNPATDITGWDLTVDGLRFLSTSKSKYNDTYIQTGGKGSKNDRVFIFDAKYAGELKVKASNVSSSEDMSRMVSVLPEEGDANSLPAGSQNSSPTTVSFDIGSGLHYIYPSGNALRFYSIEYTYVLPNRSLDSIYIDGTANKLEYTAGETFDPTGLKVMGKYDDELGDAEITTDIEWSFSPKVLSAGTTSVTVTATSKGKVSDSLTINNLVVKPTVSDILKIVQFPIVKNDGWVSTDSSNVVFLFGGSLLRFENINDSTTNFNIALESSLESSNGNYVYESTEMYEATCIFIMKNGVLSGIELTSSYRPLLNGSYNGPHIHAAKETHAQVNPTCLNAGNKVYYECDCGKYFSDEQLTNEIQNLQNWLAEGGDGYIAPLNHQFGGEVTYTWDGAKCTASWKCQREGCNEIQSEVASSQNGQLIPVFDTYATCTENTKGHYVAIFFTEGFEEQKTENNSLVFQNTALGHDFGGEVTYTWDGAKCTASWKCQREGCNETQSETVTGVYVKDSDATTESNEKGHYEATFETTDFVKQTTAANSVEIPDTKLSESKDGLSGGAVAGIAIGSAVGACLISYVAMFFVWKKNQKALKFLTPSFKWISAKIFKK